MNYQSNGELERIKKKYFSGEESVIHFWGNDEQLLNVLRYFNCLVQRDHPDAYSIIGNDALIFEHFEFDSSSNRKKGSQQRRSEAENERTFSQITPTNQGTIYHSQISADYTMENYKSNLLKVFNNHYCKIAQYKKNLSNNGIFQPNMSVYTMFFIEDTTFLGNIYETETRDNPVILPMCDFFLDLFEESTNLDYVLCGSWVPNNYQLWFIDRSMIPAYRKVQINTSEIRIYNFTPHFTGVKKIIPNPPQAGK